MPSKTALPPMTRIGNAHAPVGGGSKAIRRGAKLLNPARDNDMDCRIEALLLYQDELERQNEALRSLLAGSERQRTKYSAMFQSMPLVFIVAQVIVRMVKNLFWGPR